MNNITEKIDMYLNENEAEDRKRAKELIDYAIKKYKNNYKKIRQHLLDNVVNNAYTRNSNNFVEIVWDELGKIFPS